MELAGKAYVAAVMIFITCKSTSAIDLGEWSNFTECSRTCGYGYQIRDRICPSDNHCTLDQIMEIKVCFFGHCPIDGGWTGWTPWSRCTKTCGSDNTKRRLRFCYAPRPKYGGLDCQGPGREEEPCPNTMACPALAEWTNWSDWSECWAKTCRRQAYRTRTRECISPPSDPDALCQGDNADYQQCRMTRCGDRTPRPMPVLGASDYSSVDNENDTVEDISSFDPDLYQVDEGTTESQSYSDYDVTTVGEDAVHTAPANLQGPTQGHMTTESREGPSPSFSSNFVTSDEDEASWSD